MQALLMVVLVTAAPMGQDADRLQRKEEAVAAVDACAPEMIELSRRIWEFAETALQEDRSSAALADAADRHGFTVSRGLSGMPTAFIASYGRGRPIIGIVGEFDALPGLSQEATARPEPLVEGGAGHGCGHNLFGPGSLAAAIAIKDLISRGRLAGTIRFYGTPAEEAVGGKAYLARDGLFDDLDVCLAWHPGDKTQADTTSTQALVDFIVEFHGRSAHAAHDPWNGRSAADALELCTHGLELMREHIRPSSRIHYVIADGGKVPNVVPDYARLWCWVRDWKRAEVDSLLDRVRHVVQGAAVATDCTAELTVQGGDYEMLVNMAGARMLHDNLQWVPAPDYTSDEQAFARAIQRQAGLDPTGMDPAVRPLENQEQEGGSSDVGDVSWVVPTLHLTVATAPPDCPWHSWEVVACSGMSLGHKGMVRAARVLAATMVDLFEDPRLRSEIRREFEKATAGITFTPYIPEGPPPQLSQNGHPGAEPGPAPVP